MAQRNSPKVDVIRVSYWKLLKLAVFAVIGLVLAVVGPALCYGCYVAWEEGEFHWAVAILLGLCSAVLAVGGILIGVYGGILLVLRAFRPERIVLDRHTFQCLAADGRVVTRFAYDNVAELRYIVDHGDGEGRPTETIGIKLADRFHGDTVLRRGSPVEGDDSYDVVIHDMYRLPLERLHAKLNRHLERIERKRYESLGFE